MDIGVKDTRRGGEYRGNRHYQRARVDTTPTRYVVRFEDMINDSWSRPFDLSRVETIVLSVENPGSGAMILLDDFRLEKTTH